MTTTDLPMIPEFPVYNLQLKVQPATSIIFRAFILDTTPYAVYRHLVQDALWNSEVKYSNSDIYKCFYEHSE